MEQQQELISFWQRPAIKYGIIGGILTSLTYAVYYFLDESLLSSRLWTSLPLLFFVVVSIVAGLEKRKYCGGFANYSSVLGSVLGAFLIALAINTIFMLVLFLIIDPELPGKMVEIFRLKLEEEVAAGTYQKEVLDSFDESVEKTGPKRLMVYQSIGSFLLFSALGIILSLIITAFIKKGPK